jgi:hypothetical protein
MSFCPKCGIEYEGDPAFCPSCGESLRKTASRPAGGGGNARAGDHLSLGFNLAMAKPMVFAPVIIGGLISSAISVWGRQPLSQSGYVPVVFIGSLISIIGAVVSFILNFAAIDMARDAYTNDPLDLGRSFSYASGRIGTFFLASIVAGILSITIILIPVAILMMVIIVVDETGIVDALSQSLGVLGRDLGDIIVILLVAVIGYAVLGWVPLIGGLLTAGFSLVLDLAFIDVYEQYRKGN